MKIAPVLALLVLSLALLPSAEAADPAPTPVSKDKSAKPPKPPFKYESLKVRNGCFVDSVAFYDRYLAKKLGGKKNTWCRVLSWGVQEGDYQIGKGHAVAVFAAKDQRLWFFDINFGLRPLDVAFERRADYTDTAPGVFASYPQQKPIFVRYYDDFAQTPPKKRPDFLFYHKNPDVRDATKVAHELARRRPVRIVEFELKPEDGQPPQTTAATVFFFQAKLCLYLPRAGTHISKQSTLHSIDDLAYITRVIQGVSPGATNIRWQPGGYWLLPPKESR